MKKLLAFSLIELMISLITISCIIAAFAPVVTKKLKSSNVTVALSEITTNCAKFTDECSLCYSSKCVACSRYCNENQYKNVSTCLCENCTDRSVGCIRCDAKVCKKCDLGYGLTADGKCRLCPAGYYSDGTYDCKACPVGQYQSEQGKATCKECPLGQYQNEQGKTSCIKCPVGQYQDEQGKTGCKLCPAGQYQNVEGKTACINCPAGQYQNAEGKTSCIACPVGQYQNATGKTSCKNCPAGQYQNATGQSSCKSCWAGTYQNEQGKTSCKNCWAGAWSDANASTCYACPAGYGCNGAGTATKCSAGYYAPAGSSGCSACWAGSYSAAGASTCSACWAGSYSNAGASTCSACWAGSYSNAGASTCTACSSTWANCAACTASGCTTCDSGYVSNGSGGCKKAGPSQESCDKIGADLFYIPASLNNGVHVCATSKNVYNMNYGLNGVANMWLITAGKPSAYQMSCWQAVSENCTNKTSYGGCGRYVCNYNAAKALCAAMFYGGKSWRLPTQQEMSRWDLSVRQGLKLCTRNNDGQSDWCDSTYNCARDSITYECYPHSIPSQTHYATYYSMNNFNTTEDLNYNQCSWDGNWCFQRRTWPFSVRCVTPITE